MEKELKSCTGILLRADLTGHSHPIRFGRKGLDGHALLGQTMRTNLLNWCNLVSISKNVVFYVSLVVRIY